MPFMELEGSLNATMPCPEPYECSHILTPCFWRVHFNVHPSTSRSRKSWFSFIFSWL